MILLISLGWMKAMLIHLHDKNLKIILFEKWEIMKCDQDLSEFSHSFLKIPVYAAGLID